MNKKGFALIELLAVIVILGLFIAILFPAISKYIIQTKDEKKDCNPFNSFVVIENDSSNVANLTYNVCLVCGSYRT